MHLLSCEHPQRVYNKYIDKYVWVTCGKCNSCRNAKAYRWTDALERERLNSRYCLFVTLTFDDAHLPLAGLGYYPDFEISHQSFLKHEVSLVSNNVSDDKFCIPYTDFIKEHHLDEVDIRLFFGLYRQFGGLPYASSSVLQKFHKRLNKYFHDYVTQEFKNFRYFAVSEFGSTTLRPHFHAIYFTDSSEVANEFRKGVSLSWKQGLIDCQFVEKSACSYVAQYINKFADLPSFYQKGEFKTKYWFSKKPIIGARYRHDTDGVGYECSKDLQEILDTSAIEDCIQRKATDNKFVVVPLDSSTENYLFPKCVSFGQVSDSLRIELYSISCRYVRKVREGFKGFLKDVVYYLFTLYSDYEYSVRFTETELSRFLYENFYKRWLSDDEDEHSAAFEWLRRVYYLSRKFMRNCLIYKKSVKEYFRLIVEHYKKKELWLLGKFYEFQQNYLGCSDDLALMYPEYLWSVQNMTFQDFYDNVNLPDDVVTQRKDAAYYAESYKKTHFKNAYLDSLKFKRSYKTLFNHLIYYYYAKKRYEAFEAIAA